LLAQYGKGANSAADRALEQLFYQYGRYLLIASSRPGSLPANLQGVWRLLEAPPWQSDYHLNINLQRNYWPAEITNLAELARPLHDYVNGLQLLQSHLGAIDLLPALPAAWADGRVAGLRARGAHTLGLSWASGRLSEARLTSDQGGEVKLRNDAFRGGVRVTTGHGRPVAYSVDGDTVTFRARAGGDYRIDVVGR
jgi:hypothetical protein